MSNIKNSRFKVLFESLAGRGKYFGAKCQITSNRLENSWYHHKIFLVQ